MHYQLAYRSLFRKRHWFSTLLGAAGCMAVPVLGWATFAGYVMAVVESVSAGDQDDIPGFDPNLMIQYVKRGTAPFLVQVILLLPVFFLVALSIVVAALAIGSRTADLSLGLPTGLPERNDQFFVSVSTGLAGGVLLLTWVLSLAIVPLSLFVGLRQDLALAGSVDFASDFFRRVGKELVLAEIFVLATGLSVLVLGSAACLVGIFPAAACVGIAQHHLMAQLYGLYLQRGGTPLAPAAS